MTTPYPKYVQSVSQMRAEVPFVSALTLERTTNRPFKALLGANENGFGPSPNVIRAIETETPHIWRYGDENSYELREALANALGCSMDNLVVGEGIDGLLGNLARLLIEPGVNVVTSKGGYPTFSFHAKSLGGKLNFVAYKDNRQDLQALVEMASRTHASVLYISNPDNPMGGCFNQSEIEWLLSNLPDQCVLLLDEAYFEYIPERHQPQFQWDDPRLIRFRTFSKVHALAGLRVGYAIAEPSLISAFNKVRNHFGVNRLGQAAALAALSDKNWLNETLKRTKNAKAYLSKIAIKHGLTPLKSFTNFVTMDTHENSDFSARILKALEVRGVFIRRPFSAPQNRCIRVSVAPKPELEIFDQTLGDILSDIRP